MKNCLLKPFAPASAVRFSFTFPTATPAAATTPASLQAGREQRSIRNYSPLLHAGLCTLYLLRSASSSTARVSGSLEPCRLWWIRNLAEDCLQNAARWILRLLVSPLHQGLQAVPRFHQLLWLGLYSAETERWGPVCLGAISLLGFQHDEKKRPCPNQPLVTLYWKTLVYQHLRLDSTQQNVLQL